ncbi:MAG TPA: hypothetical protein VD886_16035, partial [Herpetosiphonaceae bacterium]|nr:hypothetical protein [Herpetosiphonaceae bacterium]
MTRRQADNLDAATRRHGAALPPGDAETAALAGLAAEIERLAPPGPAADFVDRLGDLLLTAPGPAPAIRRPRPWAAWASRRGWRAGAGALAVAVASILVFMSNQPDNPGQIAGSGSATPPATSLALADQPRAILGRLLAAPLSVAEQQGLAAEYEQAVARAVASLPPGQVADWVAGQRRAIEAARPGLDPAVVERLLAALPDNAATASPTPTAISPAATATPGRTASPTPRPSATAASPATAAPAPTSEFPTAAATVTPRAPAPAATATRPLPSATPRPTATAMVIPPTVAPPSAIPP